MNIAGAVDLAAPAKLPARSLVIANRLPTRGAQTGTGAFDVQGDVVVDCEVLGLTGKRCGWHAMGTRADVKKALNDHNRLYHAEADGPLLARINDPLRGTR